MSPTASTRRPASLIAWLTAVVAAALMLLVGVGPATAAARRTPGPAAARPETGVGAHTLAAPVLVEAPGGITAGQRRDNPVVAAVTAVGSRVAPNTTADVGLSTRGLRAAPGTRVRPEGVPGGWRVRPTVDSPGGTWYYDPTNKGNAVRLMQGNPNSPYATSRSPYVRWQKDGHALDAFGNKLPTPQHPDAHIPLPDFRFHPELFQ